MIAWAGPLIALLALVSGVIAFLRLPPRAAMAAALMAVGVALGALRQFAFAVPMVALGIPCASRLGTKNGSTVAAPTTVNSPLVVDSPVTVRLAVPVFWTDTTRSALLPISTGPKSSDAGVAAMSGVGTGGVVGITSMALTMGTVLNRSMLWGMKSMSRRPSVTVAKRVRVSAVRLSPASTASVRICTVVTT